MRRVWRGASGGPLRGKPSPLRPREWRWPDAVEKDELLGLLPDTVAAFEAVAAACAKVWRAGPGCGRRCGRREGSDRG